MSNEKFEKGLAIRKQVLGEEYVNNSINNADEFNLPLQELVTEYSRRALSEIQNAAALLDQRKINA
ncbi:hypothetical protein B4Q05_13475, partial [Acinetobacter baumannii]